MGTMAGSKTVVLMLNRFGHSVSYDEVKAMETEFAFTVSDINQETPDGLLLKPRFTTATTWDNFDVHIETLDGKDTLHATVVDIFFGLNRPNYARWGSLFLQKLQLLEPDCREILVHSPLAEQAITMLEEQLTCAWSKL